MREANAVVQRKYAEERQKVRSSVASWLSLSMARLVGSVRAADVLLVPKDSAVPFPAHLPLLRQRAPGFFAQNIAPKLPKKAAVSPRSAASSAASTPRGGASNATSSKGSAAASSRTALDGLPKVALGIEEETLRFFLTSIYSQDEVAATPELAAAMAQKRERGDEHTPRADPDEGAGLEEGGSGDQAGSSQAPPPDEDSEDPSGQAPDPKAMEQSGSDQSGLELPIARPTALQPSQSRISEGLDDSASSTGTNTAPPPASESGGQTSFHELHAQLSESELELSAASEMRGEISGAPLMTSFRQIALESPQTEVKPFAPQPGTTEHRTAQGSTTTIQDAGAQSPDSFNAETPLSGRVLSQSILTEPSYNPHSRLRQTFSSESNLHTTPASLSHSDWTPGSDRFISSIYANLPLHMSPAASQASLSRASLSHGSPKREVGGKIFPLFIQFEQDRPVVRPNGQMNSSMEESGEFSMGDGGTLSRVRRRLSAASSLRSLDSADVMLQSPVGEGGSFPGQDDEPCSQLGSDLLHMWREGKEVDVAVLTAQDKVWAHRCVLSATCSRFSDELAAKATEVDMREFGQPLVEFLLSFLYGGVTSLPEGISVWEVVDLARELDLPELLKVAELHISAKFAHFYHKPCGGCVSGVLDVLGKLEEMGLSDSLRKCLAWQSKHFPRVWKTRAFAALKDELQGLCFNAVLDSMSPGRVVEVLLGCERLQATLPRQTPKSAASDSVAAMVASLQDTAVEFIANNFDKVLVTETFLNQGRGLGLNVSLLEDVLPGVVHSLTPDTGCRVLVRLYELLVFLSARLEEERRHPERLETEWSERFAALVRRLYELADTHLIHSAAAVVRCPSWRYLSPPQQQRIRETGLFIEIQQPRAPPPRLSSLSRTYKRSLSTGAAASAFRRDRSSSTKRRGWAPRPVMEEGGALIPEETDQGKAASPTPSLTDVSSAKEESSSLSKSLPAAAAKPPSGTRKQLQPSSGATKTAGVRASAKTSAEPEAALPAAEPGADVEMEEEETEEDKSKTRPVSPSDASADASPPVIASPQHEQPASKRVSRQLTHDLPGPAAETKDAEMTAPGAEQSQPTSPTAQTPTSPPSNQDTSASDIPSTEIKLPTEKKPPTVTKTAVKKPTVTTSKTSAKAPPTRPAVSKQPAKTSAAPTKTATTTVRKPPNGAPAVSGPPAKKDKPSPAKSPPKTTPAPATAKAPTDAKKPPAEAQKPKTELVGAPAQAVEKKPPTKTPAATVVRPVRTATTTAAAKAAAGDAVRKTGRPTGVKTTTNSAAVKSAAAPVAAKTTAFKAALAKKPAT